MEEGVEDLCEKLMATDLEEEIQVDLSAMDSKGKNCLLV